MCVRSISLRLAIIVLLLDPRDAQASHASPHGRGQRKRRSQPYRHKQAHSAHKHRAGAQELRLVGGVSDVQPIPFCVSVPHHCRGQRDRPEHKLHEHIRDRPRSAKLLHPVHAQRLLDRAAHVGAVCHVRRGRGPAGRRAGIGYEEHEQDGGRQQAREGRRVRGLKRQIHKQLAILEREPQQRRERGHLDSEHGLVQGLR
mmetsp:Transcript_8880/g.32732  ORF Transcript_8880/g.32732 Transcript_8880/m.32732 type:complete len:200 (+) Transcript_8880:360-959(+)